MQEGSVHYSIYAVSRPDCYRRTGGVDSQRAGAHLRYRSRPAAQHWQLFNPEEKSLFHHL